MARAPTVPSMSSSSSSSSNSGYALKPGVSSDTTQLPDTEESLFVTDDEFSDSDSGPSNPPKTIIKKEPDPEDMFPGWLDMGTDVINLSDDEGPPIKTEPRDSLWSVRGQVIDLDSDEAGQPAVKEETADKFPEWKDMPTHIDLDADDDVMMAGVQAAMWNSLVGAENGPNDARPTPQVTSNPSQESEGDPNMVGSGQPEIIKKEPVEVPFEWRAMSAISKKKSSLHGRDVIDLDDPLEGVVSAGRAKRQVMDRDRILQIQQMYKNKMKSKNPSCASYAQSKPGDKPAANPSLDGDGFEWMHSEVIPDDVDPAKEYKKVKAAYKALQRSKKNKLEDDVQFERARIRESKRLNRIAHANADSEDSEDEASESDDGLFVPQKRTDYGGLSKRPFPHFDEDSDDERRVVPSPYRTNWERGRQQSTCQEISAHPTNQPGRPC